MNRCAWVGRGLSSMARCAGAGILLMGLSTTAVRSDLTFTGDVAPDDPALWSSSTDGHVGETSAGSVHVDDGSDLRARFAYLGETAGGTGTVTVAGTGSLFRAHENLHVGGSGWGHVLIEAGGTVDSVRSYVGREAGGAGRVTLSGYPSRWIYNADLHIGDGGTGDVLIQDEAELQSFMSYLGVEPGSMGTVTVDGSGSRWKNTGDLFVGYEGAGRLIVTNNGWVTTPTLYADLADCAGNGAIETKGAVLDNDFAFDGSGGAWATLPFGSGGLLTIHMNGTGRLGAGFRGEGSLSISGGAKLRATDGHLGFMNTATGTVTVSGAGTVWTNSNDLFVGYYGSGELRVDDGGTAACRWGRIGAPSGSVGRVTITGDGSLWRSTTQIMIGYYGNGDVLIEEGGSIINGSVQIGQELGGVGSATVTGPSSRWINSAGALVGGFGTGTLMVSSGATFVAQSTTAGGYYTDGQGCVTVHGAGSILSNTWRMFIGYWGAGELQVSDGAVATSPDTYMGLEPSGVGAVTIAGTGSRLWSTNSLRVGEKGTGTLSVVSGGLVTNAWGIVGFQPGSTGAVTVAGSGSHWINGQLEIARSGSGSLTIEDGGFVKTTGFSGVGFQTGSLGSVLVSGQESRWDQEGTSGIGGHGYGALLVEHGGRVNSSGVNVGSGSTGVGEVTVSGTGSSWVNNGPLWIGVTGKGALTVTNGGFVSTEAPAQLAAVLGYSEDGEGSATVAGAGSRWVNTPHLHVGYEGRGTLLIADGGEVSARDGCRLGHQATGKGTVMVRGAGSKLVALLSVSVGDKGQGSLVVEDGGEVSVNILGLGYETGAEGTALIVGQGSRWLGQQLRFYANGRGALYIAGGGVVGMSYTTMTMHEASLLAIDVGNGSAFSVGGGTGAITNHGTIRVVAGASVEAGSRHSPIAAGTWSGTGTIQPVGGTWDNDQHRFTAAEVFTEMAGTPLLINLAATQRVWIADAATGWNVGLSFAPALSPTLLNMTASTIQGSAIEALESAVDDGDVQGAWTFAIPTGHSPGDPAYLSFDIGYGYARRQVRVWSYDGHNWIRHEPPDLNVTGPFAGFTVTNFSGYAVSAHGPRAPHLLQYTAGPGGSIAGDPAQSVAHGEDGTEVAAQPEAGAVFDAWSDGRADNPRTDTNVVSSMHLTAYFESDGGVPIDWFAEHGLSPAGEETWADVEARYDPDKRLTLREQFIADLEPHNPASVFRVGGATLDGLIHFDSSADRLYTLHGVFGLESGAWAPVPGAGPRTGVGGPDTMQDTNQPPIGTSYRLSVELP